jgi:GNAT superfamily N-acetyltransferase
VSLFQKIKNFYFRCFHLYALETANKASENNTRILAAGCEWKQLSANDYQHFVSLGFGEAKLAVLQQRLLDSQHWQGFGIFEKPGGKLVYYCWINRSTTYFAKEIHRTFNLGKQQCIFEDDFTVPEHRGKGLHAYAMQQRIDYCRQQDIKTIYIIIECGNTPALKTIFSFGFKQQTNNPYTYRRGSLGESFDLLRKKIISRQ